MQRAPSSMGAQVQDYSSQYAYQACSACTFVGGMQGNLAGPVDAYSVQHAIRSMRHQLFQVQTRELALDRTRYVPMHIT
jgi:hypothetical protein